jgi:peptidoglycan/xylan/chitin deacetylase (PgdA/CDA1 family)
MRQRLGLIVLALVLLGFGWYFINQGGFFSRLGNSTATSSSQSSSLIASPQPTPTPSPMPLTFEEMNERWGPCIRVPVLMYHHIQDLETAQTEAHLWMTVSPETFRQQMLFLRDNGYQTLSPAQLADFFNQGTTLPPKAVLITFDDGYNDFANNAVPVLKEMGFKATVFLPTGLMDNPGYLSWNQIVSLAGSGFSFGNHTWSHVGVTGSQEKVQTEINTADTQLTSHGLNSTKVFAYPMGSTSLWVQNYLTSLGYQMAFTTQSGSVLCQQRRMALPRIRISNTSLSVYGF